jgi:hypothetical protein
LSRFGRAPQGSFQSRRPARSTLELRGDWIAAVAEAGMLAAEAEQHDDLARTGAFGMGLSRLTARLRDLTGDNFPVPAMTARHFAGAFVLQARAFINPATPPETRTACAAALRASARLLDR